jgi:CRP/FNR family transcriptional regulator
VRGGRRYVRAHVKATILAKLLAGRDYDQARWFEADRHSTHTNEAHAVLRELTEAGRHALLERSFRRNFSAGECLWVAGDQPLGLAIVLEGRVRVVTTVAGRHTVVHWGEQGSTLGEIPFFTGNPYPATAIAAEQTTCLFVNRSAFEEAVKVEPAIAYYLLEQISLRVETLVQRVAQLSAQSVQARLARFILNRAARNPDRLRGAQFSLGMTQSQLAEELGTVREVIVRSLRALRESGAVTSRASGKYQIANLDELRRLAAIDV